MELQRARNPKDRGVKLTQTNSEVIVTKSGWTVTAFVGSDGQSYERAVRGTVVKRYRLEGVKVL